MSMQKKSENHGENTSLVEGLSIDKHGIWLLVNKKEYFLSSKEFPWFVEATIGQIFDVNFYHDSHLHWPLLDIDIHIKSLDNPEDFPLVYKS